MIDPRASSIHVLTERNLKTGYTRLLYTEFCSNQDRTMGLGFCRMDQDAQSDYIGFLANEGLPRLRLGSNRARFKVLKSFFCAGSQGALVLSSSLPGNNPPVKRQ